MSDSSYAHILSALSHGGYTFHQHVDIGLHPADQRYVVAHEGNNHYLISLKWQDVAGIAQEEVPFEVIFLLDALKRERENYGREYAGAYLVLGGEGWTLQDFYRDHLEEYLPHRPLISIITLEGFVTKARRGLLNSPNR